MSAKEMPTPAVLAWRARHPLRRWLSERKGQTVRGKRVQANRTGGRFEALLAATGAGSRAAVYAWLYGRCLPSGLKLVAIEKLTGIRAGEMVKWYQSRPVPATEEAMS